MKVIGKIDAELKQQLGDGPTLETVLSDFLRGLAWSKFCAKRVDKKIGTPKRIFDIEGPTL